MKYSVACKYRVDKISVKLSQISPLLRCTPNNWWTLTPTCLRTGSWNDHSETGRFYNLKVPKDTRTFNYSEASFSKGRKIGVHFSNVVIFYYFHRPFRVLCTLKTTCSHFDSIQTARSRITTIRFTTPSFSHTVVCSHIRGAFAPGSRWNIILWRSGSLFIKLNEKLI
jgi:hypothetical protein